MLSRRALLRSAGSLPLLAAGAALARSAPKPTLKSITGDAKPISADERRARIAKVQSLMAQRKIAALLLEPGSSLDYFTGIQWHRSERMTLGIIPASGEMLVVTPAFEEPSVRETLQVGGDVRPWNEHESPVRTHRARSEGPRHQLRRVGRRIHHSFLHHRRHPPGIRRLPDHPGRSDWCAPAG